MWTSQWSIPSDELKHVDIYGAVGPKSAVGILEVQLFKKETSPATAEEEKQEQGPEEPARLALRAPSIVDYATWHELNRCIGSDGTPPPFEIG